VSSCDLYIVVKPIDCHLGDLDSVLVETCVVGLIRMVTTTKLPVRNGYHAKLWTTDV